MKKVLYSGGHIYCSCGEEFETLKDAFNCKSIRHECKHINKVYKFIESSIYCFTTSGIEEKCKDCGMVLGRVEFEYLEDCKIKEIYDLCKID